MYKDAVLLFTGIDLEKEPDTNINEVFVRIPAYITVVCKPTSDAPVFINSEFQSTQTTEKGHGRIERRIYIIAGAVFWIHRFNGWEGLKSIGLTISSLQMSKQM